MPVLDRDSLTRPAAVLTMLAIATFASVTVFMTIESRGQWDFVLPFRGRKLAALALVGYAIAVSTVLFQTVTHNRILTPAIMGFDFLYILIQTLLVFFLGAGGFGTLSPDLKFAGEVTVLVVFAALLFQWLFTGAVRSVHLLLLVGIIFGVLFRSLSSFFQRLINPNDFTALQDLLFASFNTVDQDLLVISAVAIGAVSLAGWRLRRSFDILALGRETSINLGVDYKRTVTVVLILVTILVAVSTALVGPVTFFGLLVANLAYLVIRSHRHAFILPASVLIAIISLVVGQTLLERVFNFNTGLSIIVEFLGGITFIVLLVRGATSR